MWADEAALDATRRRLDEWETSFADRAQRARALSARVSTLTGTAHNADHSAQVAQVERFIADRGLAPRVFIVGK
ncbi:hypothetical protein [Micromonospora sp. NPDC047134]|uniref:hypothetical protein n=1 Tax=Micromonospora sp. NPDC047134 TaxID=3154340 RepID=UPI003408C711